MDSGHPVRRLRQGARTDSGWRSESRVPPARGWYEVKRSDGSQCVRAFGGGHWWIPLKDGWLSGLPAGFKWRGPIAPMSPELHLSPLAEAEAVERATSVSANASEPVGQDETERQQQAGEK